MLPLSLLFLLGFLADVQGALPAGWKVCKRDQPDRNECLRVAINDAVHSLVNGNKKLQVLPIDPFRIGKVHTKGNPNGPVALDVYFDDLVLYNLKNLKVTSVELNGKNMKIQGEVPGELKADTPYKVTGRILALPLVGDGPSNFTMHDGKMAINVTFKEEPKVRNGKKYLVVDKLTERTQPAKMDINLENLFNGNKVLGDTMNKVLNDNWELVWNELKPLFEDAISEAFLQLANLVFSKIPMEQIDLI